MKPERLSDIKKELISLSNEQLIEISLKLAKYKKENKELLSYLLYEAANPLQYADSVKASLLEGFQTLKRHHYYSTKELRKILRLLAKHAKYTGLPQVELELLLWFCKNYLHYADTRSNHKPLQMILVRQLEKAKKLLGKLHEDLQFDYAEEYNAILEEAEQNARWFNKKAFEL
ncbi:hypothetical protein [Desertivirga xinjiangensis]|uniref:hypothetical protein n=1 Tax=Desertivirga xinjiangensis TaxID=539206 RepID=UPI00210D54A6|nr:hypothetical protein [Pedobacter xinjiangensis]